MTVKDLIEELEAYDENLPVYFQDDYYDTCERILCVNYEEGVVVLRQGGKDMNKYQEALDDLSYPDIYSPCYGDKCGATECGDCKIRRDILTLKELVDKATPKKAKPMYPPLVSTPYRCPCCGTLVRSEIEKFNYCHNCGQAIDWSE